MTCATEPEKTPYRCNHAKTASTRRLFEAESSSPNVWKISVTFSSTAPAPMTKAGAIAAFVRPSLEWANGAT